MIGNNISDTISDWLTDMSTGGRGWLAAQDRINTSKLNILNWADFKYN